MQTETNKPPPLGPYPRMNSGRKGLRWSTVIWVAIGLFIFYEVFVPPFMSAKRAAELSREEDLVKDADIAMIRYMGDHGARLPQLSGDLTPLLKPYLTNPETVQAMPRFVWNKNLSGMKEEQLWDEEELWMLYSKTPGQSMYAVGFCGGNVHYAATGYLETVLQQGTQILHDAPEHHRQLHEWSKETELKKKN